MGEESPKERDSPTAWAMDVGQNDLTGKCQKIAKNKGIIHAIALSYYRGFLKICVQ
jgi:hypothetical protein